MQSEVEKYINEHILKSPYPQGDFESWRVYEIAEIAKKEMAERAEKLLKEMMSKIFQGEMPAKIAAEFKQKLFL